MRPPAAASPRRSFPGRDHAAAGQSPESSCRKTHRSPRNSSPWRGAISSRWSSASKKRARVLGMGQDIGPAFGGGYRDSGCASAWAQMVVTQFGVGAQQEAWCAARTRRVCDRPRRKLTRHFPEPVVGGARTAEIRRPKGLNGARGVAEVNRGMRPTSRFALGKALRGVQARVHRVIRPDAGGLHDRQRAVMHEIVTEGHGGGRRPHARAKAVYPHRQAMGDPLGILEIRNPAVAEEPPHGPPCMDNAARRYRRPRAIARSRPA